MFGTIVVAGASGALGREVVRALKSRGHRVRALVRHVAKARTLDADEIRAVDALEAGSLIGAFDGATHVLSAVGASVSADPGAGRASFLEVDVVANHKLIDAARAAGVRRFVYVSAFLAPQRPDVAYLRAHAEVESLLGASGMSRAIVRPTGFFSAFGEFLDLAARGAVPEIGDGSARTNPIHQAELADVCADLLESSSSEDREVGGPEILTRHRILELAFAALGAPIRVRKVPPSVARIASALAHPFHPRFAEIGQFLAAIHTTDVVAPSYGRKTLAEYFRERVRERLRAAA